MPLEWKYTCEGHTQLFHLDEEMTYKEGKGKGNTNREGKNGSRLLSCPVPTTSLHLLLLLHLPKPPCPQLSASFPHSHPLSPACLPPAPVALPPDLLLTSHFLSSGRQVFWHKCHARPNTGPQLFSPPTPVISYVGQMP